MRDKLGTMNYIIDGHNLIAKIPGLSLSMPDDEEQLIKLLLRYGEHERGKVEVYFDGAPPGQAGSIARGRVRAHFVQESSSADEAMRVRLRRMGQSVRSWVVVTSDRAVQAAAHEAHARVMSADEFALRLQDSPQRSIGEAGNPADQPLSRAEVDEWLEFFKKRNSTK